MIERRSGFKFVADFGDGPPLSLSNDGKRVIVKRVGKTIAFIVGDDVVQLAHG